MSESPVIFCDAVQSVAVHNGIARISLIRLEMDGKPTAALELLIPVGQIAALMKALQSVVRAGQ
jgi:hypothetical protein